MRFQLLAWTRWILLGWGCSLLLFASAVAQAPATPADEPMPYAADAQALRLARQYFAGGADARAALLEALQLMGWSVRDVNGALLHRAPVGADTGLAMRDYELEELLWNPEEQPAIRLISVAQALAIPLGDADAEELAQTLVETIRTSARSNQPQQRFWGQFIVALGRAGHSGDNLASPSPPPVLPPDAQRLKEADLLQLQRDPVAFMQAIQPQPLYDWADPVLAESPRPDWDEDEPRITSAQRDQERSTEISEALAQLYPRLALEDEDQRKTAEAAMEELSAELAEITNRVQTASLQSLLRSSRHSGASADDDEEAEEEEDEDEDEEEEYDDPRFIAEWRDQPLSLLQVALITRVFSADLREFARRGIQPSATAWQHAWRATRWPLASMQLAQATGSGPSASGQFWGAAGDMWSTGWGYYTGQMVEQHLGPDNKYNRSVAAANTIMAWFKTIMSVVRQKITVEVENAPLVRTKTRSPGEQRRAKATVVIDFPKAEVMKAIRAAGNLTSVNLQIPDGGPVSGAKVVWRLTEGSYNNKYQAEGGGWEYRPDLAVVQFAQAGSKAAYVSSTDSNGVATITIEGAPQRKNLSPTVRPYPRRAAVSVEVTVKVGNLTQDLTDAISLATGGPVAGSLQFLADMVLRTSFFFQAGRYFEVRDWKEPAWQGEFDITIKGSGSKRAPGEKGGPETEYHWNMDRYMEGRMHTPEWEEENEQEKERGADGRHRLEIDGDRRYFRLSDSSSARTRSSHDRYEASGPLQLRPPGHNQFASYSRAEPSGTAEVLFTGDKMQLDLAPFFGAECLVARSESSGRRSANRSGPEYLSLLADVHPSSFTLIEDYDGTADVIEGTKTYTYHGSLPYVPSFEVEVTVNYRLWRNDPPPRNRGE